MKCESHTGGQGHMVRTAGPLGTFDGCAARAMRVLSRLEGRLPATWGTGYLGDPATGARSAAEPQRAGAGLRLGSALLRVPARP